jgi:hypothetical protein
VADEVFPAQSLITVQVQGGYSGWTPGAAVSIQTITSTVTKALTDAGFRPVFVGLIDPNLVPSGVFSYPLAGTLSVRTTFPYAQQQDAIYQLGQALQTATGSQPSLSVQDVEGPDAPDPSQPAPKSPTDAIFQPFQDFLNGVNTDVKYVLVGAAVLVVLLVVAVGWSPNAPKLATVKL